MGAIDGLISGLNTTQIISQLMQVERLPEQQLTDHKTASQTLVSSMQGLNSLFTALQTAANAFVPDSITKQSAWGSTTRHLLGVDAGQRDHRADGPAGQRPLHRHQRRQRRRPSSPPAPSAHSPAPVATSPFTRHQGCRRHRALVGHARAPRCPPARTPSPSPRPPPPRPSPGQHVLAPTVDHRLAEHPRLLPRRRRHGVHRSRDARPGQPTRPTQARGRDRPGVGRRSSPEASTTAVACRSARPARVRTVTLTVDHRQHDPRSDRVTDAGPRAGRHRAAGRGPAQPRSRTSARDDTLTLTGANGDTVQATLSGGLRLGTATTTSVNAVASGHPQRRRAGHLRVRRRRQRHRGRGLEQRLPAAADVHHHRVGLRHHHQRGRARHQPGRHAGAQRRHRRGAARRHRPGRLRRHLAHEQQSPASCRASPSPR